MTDAPSFLMLSANTPWVFALARALAAHRPVTAMRFYDALTWWSHKPEWPQVEEPALRRVMRVLPPGYAGRLEPLFRPMLRAMIGTERRRLRAQGGGEPWVIAPYPYLEPWVAGVPDARLIYYNLDEYTLYDPARAKEIRAKEDRLVMRAAKTLCLAKYQVEELRRRHPNRAADILHFPLGVEDPFLNPEPGSPADPMTVGYVGNLTDRVDWAFVAAVAERAPELVFNFTGSLTWLSDGVGVPVAPEWKLARDRALALPNVHHLGSAKQAEVPPYYWRSAVNWMPYDIRHGFNLASCPTKIMDAIAAARPFASTSVPEATLYPGTIHIADDPAEMAALLTRLARAPEPDPATMLAYARTQLWPRRAETLLGWLAQPA